MLKSRLFLHFLFKLAAAVDGLLSKTVGRGFEAFFPCHKKPVTNVTGFLRFCQFSIIFAMMVLISESFVNFMGDLFSFCRLNV